MTAAPDDPTHTLAGVWRLSDAHGEYDCTMVLPGDIVSALHRAGVIADPYAGQNEYEVRWIADRDWTITRAFDVAETDQSLILSRLDTVATIRVNGQVVLGAENAFRRYRVDLSTVLKPGENRIAITFHSPTRAANAAQARQPYFVPYTRNYPVPNGNMLRKPACDFGWDWNAALMPSGLYGDISLVPNRPCRIDDILIHQQHQDGRCRVVVTALITEDVSEAGTARLCGQNVEGRPDGDNRVTFEITIDDPMLWWPAGQGAQVLHELEVNIGGQTVHRRIGLRDIALISEPDDIGRSFSFRVNGRDIFAKGANWIPADALAGHVTGAMLRDLLASAVAANMNMIRVWGGGWYESDAFYDICDELGLMVWQDAMFACSLYPADAAFLTEVAQEVADNARRLQHHASLALWCGDNEMIGALNWYEASRKDRDRYLVAYDRLNRTVETALKSVDPAANWWPSSPSPGPLSFGDAWHDDTAGDMHFWSVWHEGRDFDHYRDVAPRFCSEFGFQSYPSLDVIRRFADPQSLNIASPVMESHQKNAGGNARIAETMFRYFRFPEGFANFVYLSQVQQGIAIRTAVWHWRTLRPRCMGTLYWQLNDSWPGCSWSSLDHGGGWKLLHHMARRFYQPVLATIVPDADTYKIILINDLPDEINPSISVTAVSVKGERQIIWQDKVIVPGGGVVTAWQMDAAALGPEQFLHLSWETPGGSVAQDHFAPRPYKAFAMQPPQISAELTPWDDGVNVTLEAAAPALYVALEASIPGRFSDNAFDLMPGEPREIHFRPDDSNQEFIITVRDLYSATHVADATLIFPSTPAHHSHIKEPT